MASMKGLFGTLLARFEEPSTWAGAGLGAVAIHVFVPGLIGDKLLALMSALSGFLAVVIPESPKTTIIHVPAPDPTKESA